MPMIIVEGEARRVQMKVSGPETWVPRSVVPVTVLTEDERAQVEAGGKYTLNEQGTAFVRKQVIKAPDLTA